MTLQYINTIASKANPWSSNDPVLTEDDEAFLQRVTSHPTEEDILPEQPMPRGGDAQLALMDGAQNIPLPLSPTEDLDREIPEDAGDDARKATETEIETKTAPEINSSSQPMTKKKPRLWSWMRRSGTDTEKKVWFQ
jgi:hypothetical protein